jgi:hypothetical protein
MDTSDYKLIRQGLEEASIRDLENNIQRGFPNTTKRQHAVAPIQVPIVKLTPYAPSQKMYAESQAVNQGRKYNPEMMFDGIKFEPEETETNITFTGSDNNEYNIVGEIPLSVNPMRVPGMCKHLLALVDELQKMGIVAKG